MLAKVKSFNENLFALGLVALITTGIIYLAASPYVSEATKANFNKALMGIGIITGCSAGILFLIHKFGPKGLK